MLNIFLNNIKTPLKMQSEMTSQQFESSIIHSGDNIFQLQIIDRQSFENNIRWYVQRVGSIKISEFFRMLEEDQSNPNEIFQNNLSLLRVFDRGSGEMLRIALDNISEEERSNYDLAPTLIILFVTGQIKEPEAGILELINYQEWGEVHPIPPKVTSAAAVSGGEFPSSEGSAVSAFRPAAPAAVGGPAIFTGRPGGHLHTPAPRVASTISPTEDQRHLRVAPSGGERSIEGGVFLPPSVPSRPEAFSPPSTYHRPDVRYTPAPSFRAGSRVGETFLSSALSVFVDENDGEQSQGDQTRRGEQFQPPHLERVVRLAEGTSAISGEHGDIRDTQARSFDETIDRLLSEFRQNQNGKNFIELISAMNPRPNIADGDVYKIVKTFFDTALTQNLDEHGVQDPKSREDIYKYLYNKIGITVKDDRIEFSEDFFERITEELKHNPFATERDDPSYANLIFKLREIVSNVAQKEFKNTKNITGHIIDRNEKFPSLKLKLSAPIKANSDDSYSALISFISYTSSLSKNYSGKKTGASPDIVSETPDLYETLLKKEIPSTTPPKNDSLKKLHEAYLVFYKMQFFQTNEEDKNKFNIEYPAYDRKLDAETQKNNRYLLESYSFAINLLYDSYSKDTKYFLSDDIITEEGIKKVFKIASEYYETLKLEAKNSVNADKNLGTKLKDIKQNFSKEDYTIDDSLFFKSQVIDKAVVELLKTGRSKTSLNKATSDLATVFDLVNNKYKLDSVKKLNVDDIAKIFAKHYGISDRSDFIASNNSIAQNSLLEIRNLEDAISYVNDPQRDNFKKNIVDNLINSENSSLENTKKKNFNQIYAGMLFVFGLGSIAGFGVFTAAAAGAISFGASAIAPAISALVAGLFLIPAYGCLKGSYKMINDDIQINTSNIAEKMNKKISFQPILSYSSDLNDFRTRSSVKSPTFSQLNYKSLESFKHSEYLDLLNPVSSLSKSYSSKMYDSKDKSKDKIKKFLAKNNITKEKSFEVLLNENFFKKAITDEGAAPAMKQFNDLNEDARKTTLAFMLGYKFKNNSLTKIQFQDKELASVTEQNAKIYLKSTNIKIDFPDLDKQLRSSQAQSR